MKLRWLFAAALLAAGLATVALWMLRRPVDPGEISRPEAYFGRSSVHTGAYGTRALYLLLQAQGLPAERRYEPLELFTPPGRPLIVVAGPSQSLAPSEMRWLQRYVEGGGAVLLAPWVAREGLPVTPQATELIDVMDLEYVPEAAGSPPPPGQGPGRDGVPVLELLQGGKNPATLVVRGTGRLQWRYTPPLVARALAEDGAGMAAVALRWGEGTFIVFSDLYPLTNRGLLEGDNAAFVVALARAFAGPAGVLFDDYHHGLRRDASIPRLLSGTALGWVALQGLLIVALWLAAGAVRFGEPLALRAGARRTGLEQVEALANLYERTRSGRLVARILWRRFARGAVRVLGLEPALAVDPQALALAIGRHLRISPESVLRLAREAFSEEPTSASLLRLDRQLHHLARRIEDVARTGYPPGVYPVQRAVSSGGGPAGCS